MTAYKHERYNDLKDYTTKIYVLHAIKVFSNAFMKYKDHKEVVRITPYE